ncbi:flagellar protein FliT [Metabacillus fastidiosus]|uniref:Flagellar protein FliT n=1 Tax=Metabacillus fastidiosus TaxID=1458 RepID=A0ABU6P0G2_9BACI|nr:flagellar protein FliT [Metabacillus fastidiosus]
MSAVGQVYDLTEKLFHLVENEVKAEDRDELIEEISSLLDEREDLLKDVVPPFTEEEQLKGKQIVLWNERINSEFIKIKAEVQKSISNLKKTKTTTQKYVNPYQNTSLDGMFYDKRK